MASEKHFAVGLQWVCFGISFVSFFFYAWKVSGEGGLFGVSSRRALSGGRPTRKSVFSGTTAITDKNTHEKTPPI